jgi:hypothetical protein
MASNTIQLKIVRNSVYAELNSSKAEIHRSANYPDGFLMVLILLYPNIPYSNIGVQ